MVRVITYSAMREIRWRAFAVLLVVLIVVAVAAGLGAGGLVGDRVPDDQTPVGSGLAVLPSPSPAPGATDHSGSTASPIQTADPSTDPTPSPRPPVKVPPPTSVPPDQLTGYQWPLRNAWITSRFGPRDFGGFVVIDGEEIHDGLDMATRCGDKVRAAHAGTVLYAGRNFDVFLGYWGKADRIYARYEQRGTVRSLPIVVVVDDGNGYRSLYVHLSKAMVEAGNVVEAGEIIGLEGATGYATGCHLHYGLIRMDGPWQPVVPNLLRFGYPSLVRERVNPIRILPWDDEFAPAALRQRVTPSTSPSPTTGPPASQPPSPAASPAPSGPSGPGPSPSAGIN
jgi:murein DD-endopeptidase MepM/ murein hydrolase activator NlpD